MITPSWDRYTNEDGTGLYFDLFRKIFEPVGIKLEFSFTPWKRANHEIKSGNADFMVNAYLTGDNYNFIYPRQPMNANYTVAIFNKKNTEWFGQKSMENKKVNWMRGYSFQNYLGVNVDWNEVNTAEQGWKLIEAGRVDYYLDDSLTTDIFIKENNPDMDKFGKEIAFSIKTYPRFYNNEKSRELIRIYDERVEILIENGEMEALFNQWEIKPPPWIPANT